MPKYLFLFTIGPVQSFIAQARKTQDLYAGSQILSMLVKAAVEKVGKQNVIFPFVANEDLNDIESLPNRFIAEINKPKNELAQLGKDVETAVRDKFKEIADDIFTEKKNLNLDKEKEHKILYEKFETQIKQHLDIHWLFLEFTDETYADKFTEIEQLLGAIKNVRTFEQNEELGRKCSIDGERNALFCAKGSNLKLKPNWNKLSDRDREQVNTFNDSLTEIHKGNLNNNEGLSAVSVVKRLYKNEDEKFKNFPSTVQVALMNDEQEVLKNPNIKTCFESYQKIFSGEKEFVLECLKIKDKINFKGQEDLITHFDYQQMFEESINEKNIPNSEQLTCVKKLFPSLKPHFKTKYYALIAFDVDSMGKWLSGSYLNDKKDLRVFHETLSQKLIEFAKEAKTYLDKPKGKAVYAGGDDFLGFVNLKHLFGVMEELRTKFDEIVNCKEIKNFIKGHEQLTFSAGVVVAHYKMPLGNVLNWAKKMEHEAKGLDPNNKDAFAIAVLKKSGEVLKTRSKWKDDEGNYLVNNIKYLYDELEKGKNESKKEGFSPTFIKNLNREFFLFDDYTKRDNSQVNLEEILDSEIPRLMKRACLWEDKKSKVVDLYKEVNNFYWKNTEFDEEQAIPNFLRMLDISDFLTRKITQD